MKDLFIPAKKPGYNYITGSVDKNRQRTATSRKRDTVDAMNRVRITETRK